MAEINRNRDQQNQGTNRQGNQGEDRNRDMPGGASQEQPSPKRVWDGNERRSGDRRGESGGLKMNEGSSR